MATQGDVVEAGFNKPELNAHPCEFKIVLPFPQFSLNLPPIPFPPFPFPLFNLNLALSCSLDEPIDMSSGQPYGGGRIPCFDPDPDDEEDEDDGGAREVGGL